MIKKLSGLESLWASSIPSALVSLFRDLTYVPCCFFFGEPEYPSDDE